MDVNFVKRAKNCNLLLAIPCQGGKLEAETAQGLLGFEAICRTVGVEHDILFTVNEALVSRSRNKYIDNFISNPSFTHLIFIDADMEFNAGDIFKLIDRKKDVISAICPKKVFPISPACAFERSSSDETKASRDETGELLEASMVGAAFMVIRRRAIEKMIEAYEDSCLFNPIEGDPSGGEDNAFCRRWKSLGGKIWLDPSIEIGHIGRHIYKIPDLSVFERI